jgi:hypothetical protein
MQANRGLVLKTSVVCSHAVYAPRRYLFVVMSILLQLNHFFPYCFRVSCICESTLRWIGFASICLIPISVILIAEMCPFSIIPSVSFRPCGGPSPFGVSQIGLFTCQNLADNACGNKLQRVGYRRHTYI